jgi:Tfp pilus assembly protein PilZ
MVRSGRSVCPNYTEWMGVGLGIYEGEMSSCEWQKPYDAMNAPDRMQGPEAGMTYQEWEDRRKFKRYLSEMTAQFARLGDNSAGGAGTIVNISRGGLFVRTPDPLPVGSELAMRIGIITPFGEQQEIPCEARVVWTCTRPGEEGMGMMFTKIDRHGQYAMLACAYRGHD